MKNIYSELRQLAKSTRIQNIFIAAKELSGIRLFKNISDFSKMQEVYLSFLYMYDTINRDIIVEKISEKVFDSEIYEDSYMLWKTKNRKKQKTKDDNKKEVSLVTSKKIKFN